MEECSELVFSKISKEIHAGQREEMLLLNIFESWGQDTIEEQMDKMKSICSVGRKSKDDRGRDYKIKEAIELLSDWKPKSALDIGGGTGEFLAGITRAYSLNKESSYLLEIEDKSTVLKEKKASPKEYVRIFYNEDMTIPLDDGSVDLIILAETLHHIHGEDRKSLMKEVKRLLSPNGLVIIQEHDYDESTFMYIALDVYHLFWYALNSENIDPLYLMTEDELDDLVLSSDLVLQKRTEVKSWQRIYWNVYGHTEGLKVNVGYKGEEYDPKDWVDILKNREIIRQLPATRITDDNLYLDSYSPALEYRLGTHDMTGKEQYKSGQLKLLINNIQCLCQFWDRELVPDLTVVYVGAADGYQFNLCVELFPSVTWHLYDAPHREIKVRNSRQVFKYQNLFTDKDAEFWSKKDGIFFFSDIRSKSYEKTKKYDLEDAIRADMRIQRKWVETIRPYRACLKMRLPYVVDYKNADLIYNYLDGNILLQPHIGWSSSETRLIPLPVQDDGTYVEKAYDTSLYENQMFYHNTMVRRSKKYMVNDEEMEWDQAAILQVLDNYLKSFPSNKYKNSTKLYLYLVAELEKLVKKQAWKKKPLSGVRAFTSDKSLSEDKNKVSPESLPKKKIEYTARLLSFSDANDKQLKDLSTITTNQDIMENIGNGEIWTFKKLSSWRGISKEDDKLGNKRTYYHWILLVKRDGKETVEGYVGLRPMIDKPGDLQIRTLVGTSGLGYGTTAGNLAMDTYYSLPIKHTKVWSVVAKDNDRSINMRSKNPKWKYVETKEMYNHKMHNIYLYQPAV